MWKYILAMTKYDPLEINTAEICVTLEITRTFKGSWNWYLCRFQQKPVDTIEEGILNAMVCSAPNLQTLEIRHFGNKPFNLTPPSWTPAEICWPSSRVWPSVIVQQDNTGTKHPAPLDLNCPTQYLHCFAVTLNIHCLTFGQELDEENARLSQKIVHITFRADEICLNFVFQGDPLWHQCINSCLVSGVMCATHVSSPGPETPLRLHGTAAEMSILTPRALLYILVSVSLAPTWRTILNTICLLRPLNQ